MLKAAYSFSLLCQLFNFFDGYYFFVMELLIPNYSTFNYPGSRVFFLKTTRVLEYFNILINIYSNKNISFLKNYLIADNKLYHLI